MMEHLGGPLPREGLSEKLGQDVASTEAGETWILKIMPDDAPHTAAGTVCIWEHRWQGRSINEIGWMVLPAFQGRGLGSEAVRSILHRARTQGRWDVVHAFPPVSNARSIAICRKMGFSRIEECDFEFRDRVLRCDHWRSIFGPTTLPSHDVPSRPGTPAADGGSCPHMPRSRSDIRRALRLLPFLPLTATLLACTGGAAPPSTGDAPASSRATGSSPAQGPTLRLPLFVDGEVVSLRHGQPTLVARWPSPTAPYEPPVVVPGGFVGLSGEGFELSLW